MLIGKRRADLREIFSQGKTKWPATQGALPAGWTGGKRILGRPPRVW